MINLLVSKWEILNGHSNLAEETFCGGCFDIFEERVIDLGFGFGFGFGFGDASIWVLSSISILVILEQEFRNCLHVFFGTCLMGLSDVNAEVSY